jgi:hypothetical protein
MKQRLAAGTVAGLVALLLSQSLTGIGYGAAGTARAAVRHGDPPLPTFYEGAKLHVPGGVQQVAVSDDGSVVAACNQNGVYIFTGQGLQTTASLTEPDLTECSLAVSGDGSTVVLGDQCPPSDTTSCGAGSAFVLSGDQWSQVTILFAPDGNDGDFFSDSVAVSANGSVILAGPASDAYVFTGNSWGTATQLSNPLGSGGDLVALSADGSEAVVDVLSPSCADQAPGAAIFSGTNHSRVTYDEGPASTGGNMCFSPTTLTVSSDGNTVSLVGTWTDFNVGFSFEQQDLYQFAGIDMASYTTSSMGSQGTNLVPLPYRDTPGMLLADCEGLSSGVITANAGSAYLLPEVESIRDLPGDASAELLDTDTATGDGFGCATAASADGTVEVIGSTGPGDDVYAFGGPTGYSQQIWGPIVDASYPWNASPVFAAKSSALLPVTLNTSGPCGVTQSDPNGGSWTVGLSDTGTCTLTLSQAGTASVTPTMVTDTFTITQAWANVSLSPVPTTTDASSSLTVSATTDASGTTPFITAKGKPKKNQPDKRACAAVGSNPVTVVAFYPGKCHVVGTVDTHWYVGNQKATVKIEKPAGATAIGVRFPHGSLKTVYSGVPVAVAPKISVPGVGVTVTYAGSSTGPVAAGQYPVIADVTQSGYFGGVAGTLSISPAPLMITAKNHSVQRKQKLPRLGWKANFVPGDTKHSLTVRPTCTAAVKVNKAGDVVSKPGTYPISCSGAADPNYTTSYQAGILTVTKASS